MKQGSFYKFLAVMENFKQEDQLVLKGAAKVFLQRMSVRLPGPSLFLTIIKCWHLTGSHCPSCNFNSDRGVGKVITQSGGKHPLGSTELMYLPGKHGGRGVIKVSGGRIYIY